MMDFRCSILLFILPSLFCFVKFNEILNDAYLSSKIILKPVMNIKSLLESKAPVIIQSNLALKANIKKTCNAGYLERNSILKFEVNYVHKMNCKNR